MMKFPSTLNGENLLTYEVSDETLETAGGKEIAANFTLGSCTGLSECPADQFGLCLFGLAGSSKPKWADLRKGDRVVCALPTLTST
jgi:hypothetical protein